MTKYRDQGAAPYRFRDRREAGHLLARNLDRYAGRPGLLVLALPRGGVPVAAEIASELRAPLDLLLVRKLGVPGHEEIAMGAIADGGIRVLNPEVVELLAIPETIINAVAAREQQELERRARSYRGYCPPPSLRGKTILLVDDGLVTGATMRAAVAAVRTQRPRHVVAAVPVASRESLDALEPLVDELVWLIAPEPFDALSLWYEDFRQTTDDEVRRLLAEAAARTRSAARPSGTRAR